MRHPVFAAFARPENWTSLMPGTMGRPVPRSVRLNTSDEQLDRIDELVDEYLAAGAIRVVIEFRGRSAEQTRTRAEKAAKSLFG